MTRDIRNVLRGKCRGCTECEAYISVSGLVLCDYCGCPPVQHEKAEERSSASRVSFSAVEDDTIESDRHDLSNISTSTKRSGYKSRVVYHKRFQDTGEGSQGSDSSRPSSISSIMTSDSSTSRRSSSSRKASWKSSEASTSMMDTSTSYEPSVFSTSSTGCSSIDSSSNSRSEASSLSDASRASKEKPKRKRKRKNRSRKSQMSRSLTESMCRDRFSWTKPLRLEVLMDLPWPSHEVQVEHAWNPDDCSPNIDVDGDDPFTMHRQPVAQSTDSLRSKVGYEQGMHLFEIRWLQRERGTHAVIGVCTAEAPLNSHGYSCLVGSNNDSWGWDLSRNEIHHYSNDPRVQTYPFDLGYDEKFTVPDRFRVMLDMDRGTLGFIIGDHYLGPAFTGLRGKKLYLTISAVWGHCNISMKYLGCLDAKPLSLMSLCRRIIRSSVKNKSHINELGLPQPLKNYLHF